MIARAARDVDMKSRGVDRWQGTGRSKMRKAKLAVEMWCGRHPYSCNKSQCAEECTYDGYEVYRDDKGVQHRRRVTKHLEAHAVARWWWHENPDTPAEAVLKWRADHPGNEIQAPMAVVVLGGLITSTMLNIFVIPIVYAWYVKRTQKSLQP